MRGSRIGLGARAFCKQMASTDFWRGVNDGEWSRDGEPTYYH